MKARLLPLSRVMGGGRPAKVAWRVLYYAILIVLVAWAVRGLAGRSYVIRSVSMMETLMPGDVVFVEKVTLNSRFGSPKAGDVVLIAGTRPSVLPRIKRIVAVPGDTVQMLRGTLRSNGRSVSEPYVSPASLPDRGMVRMHWQREYLLPDTDSASYFPTRDTWGPVVVPQKGYFVLGDNRGQSIDSRHSGFVSRESVVGRVRVVLWSLVRAGGVQSSSLRWDRVLAPVSSR